MSVGTERYAHLRERLENEKSRLEEEIKDLQRQGAENAQNIAEEGSYGNHMADEATDTFDQERDLALQHNLENVLRDVSTALKRMDDGTYGTCEDCGKEIPIERLEALPHVTRCVEDQAREDRRR